jgi:hypothetical protein
MDSPPPTGWLRRALGGLLALLAALWIFLEEWLWDAMVAAMAWLGRLPPVRWVELSIRRLPPYAALLVFLVPAAVLLPFKLAAFWLIAHGHGVYGLWVFIIAKVIGTALLARVFTLTRDALLTIAWFARAYHAFLGWKEQLYTYVRALPAYRRARAMILFAKLRVRTAWRKLFGGPAP